MKIKILILFCCFSNFIFAQRVAAESYATLLTQGYQINSLNGYGFENNNLTTISNISNSNPALITNVKNYSFGFSKQYNSNIEEAYIADIGYKHIKNWLPQSAGIVLPFQSFYIGAGFSQYYNAQLDLGLLEITNVQNPDRTGEFFSPTFKSTLFTSSLIIAYPTNNLFTVNDKLSIGAQFNIHFINHEEWIRNIGFETSFKDYSVNLGLTYQLPSSLQLGLFFEKGVKFEKSVRFDPVRIVTDVDVTGINPNIIAILPYNFTVTGYIPDKLSLGMLAQPTERLKITGNIINVFWNSYQENIHDQIEISSNIIYSWNQKLTTSFGIILTNRDYFGESDFYFDFSLNAVFFAAGAVINIGSFGLEMSLADSHLFSDDWRKQTLIKVGLNYRL